MRLLFGLRGGSRRNTLCRLESRLGTWRADSMCRQLLVDGIYPSEWKQSDK